MASLYRSVGYHGSDLHLSPSLPNISLGRPPSSSVSYHRCIDLWHWKKNMKFKYRFAQSGHLEKILPQWFTFIFLKGQVCFCNHHGSVVIRTSICLFDINYLKNNLHLWNNFGQFQLKLVWIVLRLSTFKMYRWFCQSSNMAAVTINRT